MVGKHNQFIGYKVYDAQRLIHRTLEVALKQHDLTPGQWNLLNQLDRAGALSQRALAEKTRKEQATITRYLDTLERKGFILRSRDANDRRAHVITLTDEARALLRHVEPVAENAADRLVEGIDQNDLDTFIAVLDRLKLNATSYIDDTAAGR